MTPEQRKRCTCPSIFCKEHPTDRKDRHVGACHCDQCRPEEWRDLPTPKSKRKKRIPWRPDWLAYYTRGFEHGEDWDCLYEGKHWAVVRVPGYTGWVSVGQTAYRATSFQVMRKDLGGNGRPGNQFGYQRDVKEEYKKDHCLTNLYIQGRDIDVFEVYEGRMNKALLDDLIKQVDQLDKDKP